LAYSPLHSVVTGVRYPAMLLTVGDHDDVVTPAHTYKFAASLQAAQSGANPVLLRVDFDVGHGPGTPSSKLIALSADRLAFLVQSLRMSR
jgi:prolyl oligopeptidase